MLTCKTLEWHNLFENAHLARDSILEEFYILLHKPLLPSNDNVFFTFMLQVKTFIGAFFYMFIFPSLPCCALKRFKSADLI